MPGRNINEEMEHAYTVNFQRHPLPNDNMFLHICSPKSEKVEAEEGLIINKESDLWNLCKNEITSSHLDLNLDLLNFQPRRLYFTEEIV
ncbi:hypothetical protein RRG08_005293 [Elysia crispata]|uniref:Uncharacterized protein n=1 Tax=Elysia crispata TaxID=231223 RepID=A0AAE0YD97_9GAST|nr:hypothetical protein RRG08_005293 [Elysia crispata]